MSTSRPTENAPGLVLFPIYEQYAEMIAEELSGLTESQAQWQSANWSWSGWSIRQNISHVASHIFRHYLLSRNWGNVLFPADRPHFAELYSIAALPQADQNKLYPRYLDETYWYSMQSVTDKLGEALSLVKDILRRETVRSLREKSISKLPGVWYDRIASRYPGTLYPDPEKPGILRNTLEGNFRHTEAELITHLFNVQRLKRAQGIPSKLTLPWIGYWTLPDWDRSEP